jgi:hypothetical protein
MTGKREKPTYNGYKTIIVPYPRSEVVYDNSLEDGHEVGIIGAGTKGLMTLYEQILLKHVPDKDRTRFAGYLNEYYRMRLWHETGINKVPVEIGRDDDAIQSAAPNTAQVQDPEE